MSITAIRVSERRSILVCMATANFWKPFQKSGGSSMVLATLLVALSLHTITFGQCAIQPIKPIPPLGCRDLKPQCVSNNNGQSYWTWICVQDSRTPSAERGPHLAVPKPAIIKREDGEYTATISHAELAPQTPVSISDSSKPAVQRLRVISQRIGFCPKALDFERRWGKKKDETEQYFQEAPSGVVWDVIAGNSVRAPYLGYIEFTVAEDHVVPDSAGARFMRSTASRAYVGIMSATPWHYRYEYDLGPDGVQLTRTLLRNKATGEWVEPNRSVIANYCWDAAARDIHTEAESVR